MSGTLGAEPGLVRSLRPPIWRGLAGAIYAMAASKPDAQGQSLSGGGGVWGRDPPRRHDDLPLSRDWPRPRLATGESLPAR